MATDDVRRPYHHGDLRAALVRASFDLLAETGLAEFSVARVARRLGVSTGAPYRHFADRDHLLSAVATQAALDLAEDIRAAAAGEDDAASRFAAATGAYARFAAARRAGLNVIYAPVLLSVPDAERVDAGRALMSLLLELAQATGDRSPEQSLELVERQVAMAHGYAMLYADGFFTRLPYTLDDIADRAAAAGRHLLGAGLGGGSGPIVDQGGSGQV